MGGRLSEDEIRRLKISIFQEMQEFTSMEDVDLNIHSPCPHEKIERLGVGTFGNVYKILLSNGKTQAALKEIKANRGGDSDFSTSSVRELFILAKLDHQNIVKLLDVCVEGRLVMEFCKCSLREVIDGRKLITEPQKRTIMKQFLSGLEYMHSKSVMHRDLKPNNLLVSIEGILKIADLGLARFKIAGASNAHYTPFIGSANYASPEVLFGNTDYDESSDMWSVGCIMAELWTKTLLFPGVTVPEVFKSICRICGSITNGTMPGIESNKHFYFVKNLPQYRVSTLSLQLKAYVSSNLVINLIGRLLRYVKSQRPTARQALNDSYFILNPTEDANLLDLLEERSECDLFHLFYQKRNPFDLTKYFR